MAAELADLDDLICLDDSAQQDELTAGTTPQSKAAPSKIVQELVIEAFHHDDKVAAPRAIERHATREGKACKASVVSSALGGDLEDLEALEALGALEAPTLEAPKIMTKKGEAPKAMTKKVEAPMATKTKTFEASATSKVQVLTTEVLEESCKAPEMFSQFEIPESWKSARRTLESTSEAPQMKDATLPWLERYEAEEEAEQNAVAKKDKKDSKDSSKKAKAGKIKEKQKHQGKPEDDESESWNRETSMPDDTPDEKPSGPATKRQHKRRIASALAGFVIMMWSLYIPPPFYGNPTEYADSGQSEQGPSDRSPFDQGPMSPMASQGHGLRPFTAPNFQPIPAECGLC
eukprot:gnl/MRDRNA2_/MRDRNA2_116794_c0_seq1.p1 gnl/MRDRNA2_/MRDRNA2_116794_c0~~gnl/MRDRNA2_/MRDRNA2_116794_c0_seq1.p1  ORF type:complete len:347 (+),score=89.72 gnl/MRDRNA2_/MRDRNA2_116794_c0_seq1:197-1237(+)